MLREYERLRLVEEQILLLEKEKDRMLEKAESDNVRKIAQLQMVYGNFSLQLLDRPLEWAAYPNYHVQSL